MDWLSFILGVFTLAVLFSAVMVLAGTLTAHRWTWAAKLLRRLGLLLLLCAVPVHADGPYPAPPKKPKKARTLAQPHPAPTPSPSPAPFDGAGDFTAPTEAFESQPTPEPTPEPPPPPKPGPRPSDVSLIAGGVVAMGGTAGLRPLAAITFDGPVARAVFSPRLVVGVDLGALPGQALDLASPETFQTLTFRVLVVQPISGLYVAPYFGGGFCTRVERDPEPLDRTARWWSAGLRIAGSRGWLEVGAGLDDRLGDGYQPTAHARGALLLGDRGGINGWLIGEAILGLRIGYAGTEGRVDVVTIGVGVGR